MNSTTINSAATTQVMATAPLRDRFSTAGSPSLDGNNSAELRKQFTQFVGEAFYGQMLKSMRATVGKPAYFHGGRAEEVFQGQLDQQMAQHLTEASAEKFADPMFERQFPHLAKKNEPSDLNQLSQLRRM
jgi:Rod binding domain-containing protein